MTRTQVFNDSAVNCSLGKKEIESVSPQGGHMRVSEFKSQKPGAFRDVGRPNCARTVASGDPLKCTKVGDAQSVTLSKLGSFSVYPFFLLLVTRSWLTILPDLGWLVKC